MTWIKSVVYSQVILFILSRIYFILKYENNWGFYNSTRQWSYGSGWSCSFAEKSGVNGALNSIMCSKNFWNDLENVFLLDVYLIFSMVLFSYVIHINIIFYSASIQGATTTKILNDMNKGKGSRRWWVWLWPTFQVIYKYIINDKLFVNFHIGSGRGMKHVL